MDRKQIDRNDLDRYITGNYGEDQFNEWCDNDVSSYEQEWFDWDCPNCGESHNDPEFITTHCRKCGLVVVVYDWGAQSTGGYVEVESETWEC